MLSRSAKCDALARVCSSALLVAGHSAVWAAPDRVEFIDLFKSLLISRTSTPSSPNWSLATQAKLNWKTTSPVPSDQAAVKDGLPFQMVGSVVINFDGEPTHSRGPGKPGRWNVRLSGTKSGPLQASLSMDSMSQEGGADPQSLLVAAGAKVGAMCKPSDGSSGVAVYAVEIPGYLPVALAYEWSAGSAGMWSEIRFVYTKARLPKMRCE
jgi:hypothetical protein